MTARARLAVGGLPLVAALVLTLIVMASPAPLPGDVALASWVQDRAWLEDIAKATNRLGGTLSWLALAVTALIAVIAGRVRQQNAISALAVLAAATFLRLLSPLLKELVASPRPDASYGISINHDISTFGFPSGHVYGDVLVYGAIAWVLARKVSPTLAPIFWLAAGLIFVCAGPSRVFVGAHWPTDVVGGYLWGAAALSAAIALAQVGDRRRPSHRATPPAAPAQSTHDG